MKLKKFLLLICVAYCFTGCKTVENSESIYNEKRLEIEAITAQFSAINPNGPTDWEVFRSMLQDDKVVERFDIDLYTQCLESQIALSKEKLRIMEETGCKSLYDNYFALKDMDVPAFRDKNRLMLQHCDSLQASFDSQRVAAWPPCQAFLEKLNPHAYSSGKNKSGK